MVSLGAAPRVVLDLSDVRSWDDLSVGAVIGAVKRALAAGGRLVVAGTPADLMERFRQLRLGERCVFHESVADAVAEFRRA
ncbi:STAS domain-containing protein [Thermoactinospora rubra]|uniref:STAS domain-containing protein n=1 Tax=Thermoactinospora rubra TaxID=1088767 RepID=UPI003B8475BB